MTHQSDGPRFTFAVYSFSQLPPERASFEGHAVAVYAHPDYTGLLSAAEARTFDVVVFDRADAPPEEYCFLHLLTEVLWYRFRLETHPLGSETAIDIPVHFELLLSELMQHCFGSGPQVPNPDVVPFGYRLEDGQLAEEPEHLETLKRLITAFTLT